MAENFENEHPDDDQNFADLLESYSSRMKDDLQVGDKITGKIVAIGKDSVFLDTGTKVDGAVDKSELLDEEGNLAFAEGDELELYVVAFNDHEIRLSKAISGIGGLELLQDAYAGDIPVEGKVNATCKGGFHVDMVQRRAFCPISQIDITYVETPEDYVGNTYEFLITQLEDRGKNIVVSRRKILAEAMEKEKAAFLGSLKEGDAFTGRVTKVMPYGAFVELIPGVEGLVHVSELSWSRVENPEDVVRTDDRVSVVVTSFGERTEKGQQKISLSMKQVDSDPWDSVVENFRAGDKVSGTVTRCAKFGAFVEISPGIEGLVHISEMSYVKRVVRPDDVVQPGESVSVLVKEVDAGSRRISLSLRDAEGDPWADVGEKFSAGQEVMGTLEKKEPFGFFVTLEPGITGLLPKSRLQRASHPGDIEKLKEGDSLPVIIEEIRPRDRRITLTPGDAAEEGAWKRFAEKTGAPPMSDLAEKLQQALASKKKK